MLKLDCGDVEKEIGEGLEIFFMIETDMFKHQNWFIQESPSEGSPCVRDYKAIGMKTCDNFLGVPAFTVILTEVITIQCLRSNKKNCAGYLLIPCQQMCLQFPAGKTKSTGSRGKTTKCILRTKHWYLSGLVHTHTATRIPPQIISIIHLGDDHTFFTGVLSCIFLYLLSKVISKPHVHHKATRSDSS